MVLKWCRINWICFNLLFIILKCIFDFWIINFVWVFDVIINLFNWKKLWNVIKNKVLSKSIWVWLGIVCFKVFIILMRIFLVIGKCEFIVGFILWYFFSIFCIKKYWVGFGILRILWMYVIVEICDDIEFGEYLILNKWFIKL